MKLTDLLKFDSVVIQCHNDPDADALASGYGIYVYLQQQGKNVELVYGGKNEIKKSNLVLMIRSLNIPIKHVEELVQVPELLLTVDCQYGEKNVQQFSCRTVAVIDHHKANLEELPELREVRDNYGACATIVWDMLQETGYDICNDENLAAALYYGLFMDTNKMQELRHPKDRDLRDQLEFRCSRNLLFQFQSQNLSLNELKIAGNALAACDYCLENRFAVAEVAQCDPNILGIISDMMIEVDVIDLCVAYCVQAGGVKYSVRSSTWVTQAQQLAQYLAEGVGNGGGHLRKAGGFLSEKYLTKMKDQGYIHRFFISRLREYFQNQDIIHLGNPDGPDLSGDPVYEKERLPIGYVYVRDLGYSSNTELRIRMLEGDKIVSVQERTVIIIGVESEVYTNDETYFLAHNDISDAPYEFHGEYAPTVREAVQTEVVDEAAGEGRSLEELAKVCIPKSGSCIHARQLTRRTKVLDDGKQQCMQGMPGDWLAARQENVSDMYIIKKNIFEKTYKLKEIL